MRSIVIGNMEKAWLEEGESSGGWSGDVASGIVRTRLGDKTTNQEPVIHRPLLFACVSRMAVPPDLRSITVGAGPDPMGGREGIILFRRQRCPQRPVALRSSDDCDRSASS